MATVKTVAPQAKSTLLALVDEHSGQRVMSCYQCGKCSAGCPMASSADVGPRQVLRAVQMGDRGMALGSEMIWMCLACQTCTVRCPREIDVAAVMDALRHIALAEGERPAARDLYVFHRAFLTMVERGGRLYELGVGGLFNGLSGKPLTNADLLPRMLMKGKLDLLPRRSNGAAEVGAIFERVAAMEGRRPPGKAAHGKQEGAKHGN
jgi:heterodisulfide reductase subunit C2